MKHVNWIVAGVFALAFLWVAWIVQPAPQTQIIDETRYIPSEAISKDAFEQQRYRADIAEIRADALEAQRDWYAIIVAAIGLLVTVLIIYFAFKFGNQAVAEAKLAAKDALAKEQDKLQALIDRAEAAASQIENRRDWIEELTKNIPLGNQNLSDEKKASLKDIVNEALRKPKANRTLSDYRALVFQASIDQDWPKVLERAIVMAHLFDEKGNDEDMAFALCAKAIAMSRKSPLDLDGAIASYSEVIARYGKSDNAAIQERVAMALLNKGAVLSDKSPPDLDGAIASYDDVVSRYDESDNVALQEQVAKALFNKGRSLARKSPPDLDGAIARYDDVVLRYGESDYVALQEPVAHALVNKGVALARKSLPDLDGEIASYDDVVARFGESDNVALQEQVAKALFNKGVALGSKSPPDLDGAIASFDDIVVRYGESDNAALDELVADALDNKGIALRRKSPPDLDGAIGNCDEVIKRYAGSSKGRMRETFVDAFFNKASLLALQDEVMLTIQALSAWAEYCGKVDCDKIAKDPDFDKVRDRASFQKFLREHDCQTASQSPNDEA